MRPEILFPYFADIYCLSGIGEKYYKLVKNLVGGTNVVDLLWHFPNNIVNRSYQPKISNAIPGSICTLKVKIVEHVIPKQKSKPYRVVAEDETGQIVLTFFKAYPESLKRNFPINSFRIISGKVEKFNNLLQMSHPDYVVKPEEISKLPKIETIYPLTAGVSNKMFNKYISQIFPKLTALPEWQDKNFLTSQGFPSFNKALEKIHHPKCDFDLQPYSKERCRIAYDELLANQLSLQIAREKAKKEIGRKVIGNGLLRNKIIENLPFKLTSAQENVLKEIFQDQASSNKMLRLLQGDVGSGKTIVAFLTMLNAIECGFQSAIMAPTEILAKQHMETISSLCDCIGIRAELLTGKVKGKKRKEILKDLASGDVNIIIGTHALFVDDVEFKDLACVIIDEQHRFGVHQRLKLSQKGKNADILVMTATPIPRTLLLTSYGDMDYSKIDQVPEGRKPVNTLVMPLTKISDVVAGLKRKISEGVRGYWVCPLVEESEKIDLAAAEERFSSLKQVFGNQVGLIHGKMKEKDKDAIMDKFKSGDIKILVATTVIEVGVNVPEATIMIIEHAERFGLAQLHQLRGRIKRGFQSSTCILLYNYPLSENSRARLDIMKKTENGFEIAEKDLELRGGGDILGTRQSGFCEFKIANLDYHKNLLLAAHRDAQLVLANDPQLKTARGKALRTLLYLFEKDKAMLLARSS